MSRSLTRHWVRARIAKGALSILLMAPLLALAGCEQDPYTVLRLGDATLPDVGPSADNGPPCVPTNNGIEICDGKDNDCNGQIDEGFNLDADPRNCGKCGVSCLKKGALTACELGICKDKGCAPGFYDLNLDRSDGCEYECTPSGPEICDEQDNDCNGKVDETFDLMTDVNNCGTCGVVCSIANAVARCEQGVCRVQSCKSGFIDKDGKEANGCEEPCVKTNGGVEICDSKDNDCNGVVDDPGGTPVDFQSDPFNCGGCNTICVLANADAICQAAQCVLDQCKGQYKNADGDNGNGCECLATGPEVCDGVDNDCNGLVDDGLAPLGACGSDVGECKKGSLVCQNGIAVCVGATGPKPETCDGNDNDCDGTPDNGLPPSLGLCGSDVGTCQKGTLVCENGAPVCKNAVGPQKEVCDGKDNDCDGTPDNGLPQNLGACGSATGECKQGQFQCQAGVKVCVGATGPQAEVCDGKDNDCDGTPDNKLPASLGICGNDVGECRTGSLVCQNGAPTCVGAVGAQPEICDGKDNDCDGTADNGLPASFGPCGTNTGECSQGTLQCIAGAQVCVGAVHAKTEHCDGKDTDCDGTDDDPLCVFAAAGRERKLSQPTSALGTDNSAQLTVACDGSDVLAIWLDRRNSPQGDLFGNRSTNGAMSWLSPDTAVATENQSKVEPQVAFGGPTATSKRVYLAYARFASGGRRDVYLRRSLDGGATWQSAQRLDAASNDSLFPRLVVDPGATSADADRVVVCWEEINTSGVIQPNVLCNLSTNSAQSFTGARRVNTTPGSAILPEVAIDHQYVYVTWQESADIMVARAPLGTTPIAFTNETTLSLYSGKAPQIAADGSGRVLVVWEDLRTPLSQVRASRSQSRGASWPSDGQRVDNDVVDGDSMDPVVAYRPGGRAFVAWADTSRGAHDIYVNTSGNGGGSWGAVAQRVSDGTAGAATSSKPRVAVSATGARVYVVWEDRRNGSQRDIYFNQSLDDGVTWNIPDNRVDEASPAGASDARDPHVCIAGSRVAIVWLENRSGSAGSHTTGANADVFASYVQ